MSEQSNIRDNNNDDASSRNVYSRGSSGVGGNGTNAVNNDVIQNQQLPGNDNSSSTITNSALLSVLLDQLTSIASRGGYDGTNVVSRVKAQNVLEATAGDVPLAAQLYWDDFLASEEHHHQRQQRQASLAAPSAILPQAQPALSTQQQQQPLQQFYPYPPMPPHHLNQQQHHHDFPYRKYPHDNAFQQQPQELRPSFSKMYPIEYHFGAESLNPKDNNAVIAFDSNLGLNGDVPTDRAGLDGMQLDEIAAVLGVRKRSTKVVKKSGISSRPAQQQQQQKENDIGTTSTQPLCRQLEKSFNEESDDDDADVDNNDKNSSVDDDDMFKKKVDVESQIGAEAASSSPNKGKKRRRRQRNPNQSRKLKIGIDDKNDDNDLGDSFDDHVKNTDRLKKRWRDYELFKNSKDLKLPRKSALPWKPSARDATLSSDAANRTGLDLEVHNGAESAANGNAAPMMDHDYDSLDEHEVNSANKKDDTKSNDFRELWWRSSERFRLRGWNITKSNIKDHEGNKDSDKEGSNNDVDDESKLSANNNNIDKVIRAAMRRPPAIDVFDEALLAALNRRELPVDRNNNDVPPDLGAGAALLAEQNPLPPPVAVNDLHDNAENEFAEVHPAAAAVVAIAESISVSDDEGGLVGWEKFPSDSGKAKKSNKRSSRKHNYSELSTDATDGDRSSKRRLKKTLQRLTAKSMSASAAGSADPNSSNSGKDKMKSIKAFDDEEDDIDIDGYLSENDWVLDTRISRDPLPSVQSLDILWKGRIDVAPKKASAPACPVEGSTTVPTVGTNNEATVRDKVSNTETEEKKEAVIATPASGIPYTWLNAGFQFSVDPKYNYGLALHPPRDSDVGYSAWKTSDHWRGTARNAIPPPYHCRALTALLSVVNALLYSGACVPGNGWLNTEPAIISIGESRRSLVDITNELQELDKQRKEKQKTRENAKVKKDKLKEHEEEILFNAKKPSRRELESRLADALSSLIAIAIRASVDRKMKKLKVLKESNDIDDIRRWQLIQRKLRLCPTCWWDPESLPVKNNSDSSDNSSTKKSIEDIRIAISSTSIDDIRPYVLANMPAFMASGGCALFLEVISRIHGEGAITRMFLKARQNANTMCPTISADNCVVEGVADARTGFLINCTCGLQHKEHLDSTIGGSRPRNSSDKILDTTPHSHQCISTELISLLLTGRVQSTLQGWSANPLGIGILTNIPGQVGKCLTRPEKPVWILRGPTSYTCLWLNGCNDLPDKFSTTDNPMGSIAVFGHWNGWYNIRNYTQIRMVSNRSEYPNVLPTIGKNFEQLYLQKQQIDPQGVLESSASATMIFDRRRKLLQQESNMKESEIIDPKYIVSEREMNSVVVHPNDSKYYPGKYRLWRYQLATMDNDDFKENISNEVLNNTAKTHDTKEAAENTSWKAYHHLTARERLIVEAKLGPKINLILWSRWPNASIDFCDPEDPPAVV